MYCNLSCLFDTCIVQADITINMNLQCIVQAVKVTNYAFLKSLIFL